MNVQNIEARVTQLVAEQMGMSKDDIKLDQNFVQDLGGDSLDVVEITMATEDEFDLVILDEDAEKFVTGQAIVDYVKSKLGDKLLVA
jgi:acyl carrier protein